MHQFEHQHISKIIKNVVFSCLCFTSASIALADSCGLVQIKSREFGVDKVRTEAACFDADQTFFVSQKCQTSVCLAEKLAKTKMPFALSELGGEIGTPQAGLCQKLGGAMSIVEFQVKGDWIKSDLCRFADGSFANGDLLMKENREAIQRAKVKSED